MKLTLQQIRQLQKQLVAQRTATGMTLGEIGSLAGVHPSQVGRIFQGKFRTYSYNVMRVCEVLNVQLANKDQILHDAHWKRLERSVRKIWDGTPKGAKKVSKLLESIAELRST